MWQSGVVRLIGSCAASVLMMMADGPAWSRAFDTLPIYDALLQSPHAGTTRQQYVTSLRSTFVGADADSDEQLTQSDVDLHTVMEDGQSRAQALGIMRYDLDGDGFITEDEIRRATRYEIRAMLNAQPAAVAKDRDASAQNGAKMIENKVQQLRALDADKDGKVSLLEATKPLDRRGQGGFSRRVRHFLTTDIGSRGSVSWPEFEAAGQDLFRRVDDNNDGTISQQEYADYRARAERAGCEMPKASANAKLVLLSAYDTEALSSVTIGAQEMVVHAGRIVVEPGTEPLYVVIPTYAAIIWQFSGATDRIERVVLTSALTGPNGAPPGTRPLVGATGLNRDRITFFSRPNCLNYFSELPTSGSLQASGSVRVAAGKAADTIVAAYKVSGFSIPSGKVAASRRDAKTKNETFELAEAGPQSSIIAQADESAAKNDLRRYSPGGVIDIDANAVIASEKAVSYDVLPQEGGLVQLLQSGALKQNRRGEYIVTRKIRFPAGLNGAHSVTFLVMNGVPYPDGDPGHSCAVVEETGIKKGSACGN